MRLVKSPVAPKIVITQGAADGFVSGWFWLMNQNPFARELGHDGAEILMAGLLLDVSAKLKAHGGQHLGSKIVFTARREALIQRGAENRRRRR